MAKYIGYGDINELECFRCENLNRADEEEWNRCINQECVTVLLYFVFSEKSEKDLLKEYEDLEHRIGSSTETAETEMMEQESQEETKRDESENAEQELQEELDQEAELSRVMDRIVEQYWGSENGGNGGDYTLNDFLDEYKRGNEYILWEDHLVYFDGAENGRADVYGVISPEFGTKGIIIDYKEQKGDDSNTNYFDWNWDVMGFCPQIEMADFDGDGREEIFFRLLGGKDPDLMYKERLFICETYETCTVVPYELTTEIIDEEIENLLEAEVIEDEHRVKISEKGTDQVLIPKLFYGYKGAGEYEKMSYASDWMIIDYVEDTHEIYLAMKPVVYVKYDSDLKEGYPTRFTTENEYLTFKIRYDESASLGSGYFTLSNPDMRRNLWE